MKRLIALVLAGVCFATTPIWAGNKGHKQGERAQDQRELNKDANKTIDDQYDLAWIENLLVRYDAARARRARSIINQIDRDVMNYLTWEVKESRREVHQKQAEVKRDNRELNSDKRELNRNAATGAPPAANAKDVHDMRDDHRDRNDDIRDVKIEAAQMNRLKQILAEYKRLAYIHGPGPVGQKRALIAEVVAIARGEVIGNVKETNEDLRELREDQREHREIRK